MNIQKLTGNNQDEPIFHSNAYAHVAHGSNIGSTDKQTFQDRMYTHRNRQAVRHYGDSLIGRGDMREASKDDIDGPLRQPGRVNRQGQNTRRVGLPRRNRSVAPPRQSFREPPSRGFNPYS